VSMFRSAEMVSGARTVRRRRREEDDACIVLNGEPTGFCRGRGEMNPELYVRKDVKGLPRKNDFGIGIVGIVSAGRLVTTSDVQHPSVLVRFFFCETEFVVRTRLMSRPCVLRVGVGNERECWSLNRMDYDKEERDRKRIQMSVGVVDDGCWMSALIRCLAALVLFFRVHSFRGSLLSPDPCFGAGRPLFLGMKDV
jgi:hypothetical protein